MNRKALWVLIAGLMLVFAGCGDDDDDNDPKSSDEPKSTDGDGGVGDTGGDTATVEIPTDTDFLRDIVALDENFDEWEAGAQFYTSKPAEGSGTYEDHGTKATIAEHDCLTVHEVVEENGSYGFAAEVQFQLNAEEQPVDMSYENFVVQFDIYVPQATLDRQFNVQFAFYETEGYTPIYSDWWSGSLIADTWVTLTGKVDTTTGWITYAPFSNNPGDWQFNVFRIQGIYMEEGVTEGDEMLFYVDNILVNNTMEVSDGTDGAGK